MISLSILLHQKLRLNRSTKMKSRRYIRLSAAICCHIALVDCAFAQDDSTPLSTVDAQPSAAAVGAMIQTLRGALAEGNTNDNGWRFKISTILEEIRVRTSTTGAIQQFRNADDLGLIKQIV